MAKFKSGDRVRLLDHPYILDEGQHVGTVIGKAGNGWRGSVEVKVDDYEPFTLTFRKRELELIADNDNLLSPVVEEAWVPKVGERVRYSGKSDAYSDPWMIGTEGTVTGAGYGAVDVKWDVNQIGGRNTGGGKYVENLEPVPVATQPAPLTIEAGKFYLTRDGRNTDATYVRHEKHGGGFYAKVGGTVKAFYPDGTHIYGEPEHDLVAELDQKVAPWTALATPEPVAVAATPTSKFKVGDKVRRARRALICAPLNFETVVLELKGNNRFWYDDVYGERVNGLMEPWELVTEEPPAAPPAKFNVGDRVRIKGDSDVATVVTRNSEGQMSLKYDAYPGIGNEWWHDDELEFAPSIRPGSTVTFTATGRVSAINENGHVQVTFPNLLPGQNSFALPAQYVSLAN